MDFLSIFNFLSPIHLGTPFKVEILPILFFAVIWTLFGWTIFRLYRKAKPENWENNWYGGDKNNLANNLDAEHGSVMDISEAVATPAEKMAEIMPGMILIIGLLGTFLGLGLALDKASSILSGADLNSMDSSMTQLMGMLEGLGTKFKTSTWGLLAFILLKVILSKNGYEERRLRWCIAKVKNELDVVRDKHIQQERAHNQELIDCMHSIAIKFDQTVQANQDSSRNQLEYLITHSENTVAEIRANNERQDQIIDILIKNQADSTSLIEKQALTFGNFLTTQNEKSDNLITLITSQHHESKRLLADNVQQSKETRNAMVGFVEKNEATVSTLGKSAAGMSKAASTMGNSATHLQQVIDHFRINMEEVVGMMKTDLNTTISGMNTSFGSNMTKMSENLRTSIGDMSGNFKKNMSEMSQGLGTATQDISRAVTSLSASVDKTMAEVTSTINTSMDLQTKAQSVFIESTDSLNEYISEMTGLVNKLSDDIKGGLKAVSDSNRNMINLAKRTDNILESMQTLDSIASLKPVLENLANSIELQKEAFQKINSDPASRSQQKKNNAANKPRRTSFTSSLLGTKGASDEG